MFVTVLNTQGYRGGGHCVFVTELYTLGYSRWSLCVCDCA